MLVDEEEGYAYELLSHSGPSEQFPVTQRTLEDKLGRSWCYLLAEEHSPVSLSPLFSSMTCTQCQRVEIFAADRLVFGPKGTEVPTRGLTTDHEAKTKLQWTRAAASFYQLLQD